MEASALSHPVGLGRVSLAGPLLRLRSDDQLVALFRAGHDEAFGTIHDRYRQRLFAYTRQMLGGSRSDAEDVLQDVFLRAYHALRADGRPVALRAWLYRVAHNRCIDHLRRPAPAAEDIYDLNRGVSTDLLDEAQRREDLRRLIADVRALPEQQRSALLMREMEGLSYLELAAALGVTVPAIKSLLVRARIGLVEAVEARDTACVEIRDDLVAAFDRGVRASGRSRRHLRECAGCRDFRTALRGVDKALNGLAPASGPLAMLAKILGIGGAGSGAAAGGSAVAAGGGGAAGAGAAGAGVATVGTGAVAATATKVVAVMAAAAVVGGSAATVEQRVEHPHAPAPRAHVSHAAPAALPNSGFGVDLVVARRAPAAAATRPPAVTEHGATRAPHGSAPGDGAAPTASPGAAAPTVEPTTGGILAPDDAAPAASAATPATTGTTTGPGGAGTATAGNGASTGATSTATESAAGSTHESPTSASSTGTASGGSGSPGTGSPSGSVSATSSAPIAQGASATPAPAG